MESDKISKCCCDVFKIQKKTSNCVVTCYHKRFSTASLQCLTRKWEETIVQCRKKIMQMPGEVQVEQRVPPHKKN